MPIGRVSLRSGTERPVTALKFCIKKSAYLKYPKKVRLETTEKARKSFASPLPRKTSIKSPNTYPSPTVRSIKKTYRGSPQA